MQRFMYVMKYISMKPDEIKIFSSSQIFISTLFSLRFFYEKKSFFRAHIFWNGWKKYGVKFHLTNEN